MKYKVQNATAENIKMIFSDFLNFFNLATNTVDSELQMIKCCVGMETKLPFRPAS